MQYPLRIAFLLTSALVACSPESLEPTRDAGPKPDHERDAQADTDADTDAGSPDPEEPDAQVQDPDLPDPFASQPDVSEGLVNVSADLDAVLEHDKVKGACEAYRSGQTDRATMLRCGKWMFFWEGFGTQGVPKALATFLLDKFPD